MLAESSISLSSPAVRPGAAVQAVSAGETRLLASGLRKVLGKRTVLEGLSLSVGAGELVGLLGPNGAGKSTTFKLLTGLWRPTAGTVQFMGETWENESLAYRVKRGLGYLPQEASIFRRMSARENLLAALQEKGGGKAEMLREVEQLEERFQLARLSGQSAETLSGGERRRLEIARACALKPQVLLLDEPFAGIDPVSIDDLIGHVRRLKEEGMGLLITDHNVYEALPLCDRAIVLHRGAILAEGTPAELMQHELVKKFYLGSRFGGARGF